MQNSWRILVHMSLWISCEATRAVSSQQQQVQGTASHGGRHMIA